VSTKLNYRIRNILKRNNLVDIFDIVVGADNVSESKPDPEGLLLAMRCLRVNSSAVLKPAQSALFATKMRQTFSSGPKG
jgi:phosphoglycolate phosphatase